MPKVFVIIDGSSLVHRAFYALPLLTTSSGQYSNAVYGFATMLTKLMAEVKPDMIAVAFDKGKITFRNEVYAEYKAQRKGTPIELVEQFPLVYEFLEASGIATLEKAGYEADDIIGTLAYEASQQDYEVLIVTGDKDALQLIDKNTKVMLTKKGITDTDLFDEKMFYNKYGVEPKKLIDLKGLMGDTSDNIPGVPGIGEKTACKLIMQFSSVENLLQNIEAVSGNKLKEKLRDNVDMAKLSKQLATIKLDVPLTFSFEDFAITPDGEKLTAFLVKMGFKSLLAKMDHLLPDNKVPIDNTIAAIPTFHTITTLKQIQAMIEKVTQQSVLCFFPITKQSVPVVEFEGVAIATEDGTIYIPEGCEGWQAVIRMMQDDTIAKVTHDAKRSYQAMLSVGLPLSGVVFDTLIAEYLLDPTAAAYPIVELSSKYLQQQVVFEQLDTKTQAVWSAKILLDLYPLMKNKLQELALEDLYYEIELPLVKVLSSMEWNGIAVDAHHLHTMNQQITDRITELLEKIYLLAGETFNVNSPKQLGVILFEKLNLPVIKKTKTGYSTDVEVLDALQGQHPLIDEIVTYRLLSKLKSTYLDGMQAIIKPDGRIHTSFNQVVTATGRLSSSDPNLQNIPIRTEEGKRIRELFVPGQAWQYIMSADYSQIELRILAHMAEDSSLIEAFNNNQDIHTRTASEVFDVPMSEVTSELRSRAKAVNFGIVYGISDYGLSRDLKISRAEANQYITSYFSKYRGVKECIEQFIIGAKEHGFVKTLLGRIRYLPEINSGNFNRRSFAERVAMNTPIQGTAADIIKKAMIAVHNALIDHQLTSRLLLQVHDELILEVTEEEKELVAKIVKEAMEGAIVLKVPLVADIKMGVNWARAK